MKHPAVVAVLALLLCSAGPSSTFPRGSVQVGGCSGTLIYRDLEYTYGVSAAHCSGKPGESVRIVLQNGRAIQGEWVSAEPSSDLALFRMEVSEPKLTLAQVTPALPQGRVTAMGRHGLKHLKSMGADKITDTSTGKVLSRRGYTVEKGKYRNGDSGSGVYAGGILVGVASHGKDDKELYAASHAQLVKFLKERNAFGPGPEGSDWGDKDRTREILALKRRLSELESAGGKAGPVGPAGPAGRDGRDGEPGTAADISGFSSRLESLEHWRSNFRATIRIRLRPVKE